MTDMAPQIALTTAERAIRQLMESVYPPAYGEGWLTRVAPEGKPAEWAKRLEAERGKARTRGEAQPSERLIDYGNLYELLQIADQHWAPLSPALGKQRSFSALLGHLEQLRDPIAHSRQLLPFQCDLAAGIAGYIRNKVTIYLSTQDELGEFFPRMESARDSFGNELAGGMQEDGLLGSYQTGLTLIPGEVVLFDCTGWDAQGRTLRWDLIGARRVVVDEAVGNEVTLRWEVQPQDIGVTAGVHIRVKADGAAFHRYAPGESDGRAFFNYRVLPRRPQPPPPTEPAAAE